MYNTPTVQCPDADGRFQLCSQRKSSEQVVKYRRPRRIVYGNFFRHHGRGRTREIDLCFLFAFCKCQCAACTHTTSNKEGDTRLKSRMRLVHYPIDEVPCTARVVTITGATRQPYESTGTDVYCAKFFYG